MDSTGVVTLALAAATLAVAAATLYVAVKSDRRQRRLMPSVQLEMRPYGEYSYGDAGTDTGYIWELVNAGTGDARIWLLQGVGCEFVYTEDYPPVTIIRGAKRGG